MRTLIAPVLAVAAALLSAGATLGGEPDSARPSPPAPASQGPPLVIEVDRASPPRAEPHSWSHWLFGQEVCHPGCCARPNWPGPLEVFVRAGPMFVLGDGAFEKRLDTGVGIEGGARAFCYYQGGSAAWTGELAVGHSFHNSKDSAPLLVRDELASLDRFHLTSVRFGGGHEWHWQSGGPESSRWFAGVNGGGRLGSATARFLGTPKITEPAQGLYLGLDAGVLIPWDCRQIVLGVRAEWQRDWFELGRLDVDLERLNLLLTAGIRY